MLEIKQLPIYTELVNLDSSALHLSSERFYIANLATMSLQNTRVCKKNNYVNLINNDKDNASIIPAIKHTDHKS